VSGDSQRRGQHDRVPAGSEGRGEDVLVLVARELARWRAESSAVTVVAIDGHGAAGKSTLARWLSTKIAFSLVHTDEFFTPVGSVAESACSLGDYYDIARLRAEALGPLRSGDQAVYRSFDWHAGRLGDGTERVAPGGLVVLEGVYSAAPDLADLVDRAIYVDTPEPERLARLRALVAPEDWDARWLSAETAYFAKVRPPESFDLVVSGTGIGPTQIRPL